MNGLFQQKQMELVRAVSRVEELGRQLEMLRSGKFNEANELERLYKELQVSDIYVDDVFMFILHLYTDVWNGSEPRLRVLLKGTTVPNWYSCKQTINLSVDSPS